MSVLLHDRFSRMQQVTTRDELLHEVVRFGETLGFLTISAVAVFDGGSAPRVVEAVHNTPAGFYDAYEDMDYAKRDPVAQHCRFASVPIAWNQETYASIGEGERWEMQAGFGYRTGIALATHFPGGRHFFIGVDRDQALPACSSEVSRLAADLSLFAMHTQDVALRVLAPAASSQADFPTLTSRELESLRWTMEGKTAWEVGRILGISEQTAVRHVNNATHKLDCVNKHHAVVKALRLGLIR